MANDFKRFAVTNVNTSSGASASAVYTVPAGAGSSALESIVIGITIANTSTAGSSGAYTQIVVSDSTPQRLYYQCSSHELMGNMARTSSTSFADTTGSAILTVKGGSITDSSGAISFGNENLTTTGSITVGSSGITFSDGTTQTSAGATNAFAIAQAVALG